MAFAVATPKVSARSGARCVVARAQKVSVPKQASTALAAVALASVVSLGAVDAAQADVAGLTPCSESKAYAKNQKNSVKKLEKRKKQYEEGSAPALALDATIQRTNARFKSYADKGVLCGTDGLPHLIADPGLALRYGHAGEIFIPTLGFLYIAGYIGHTGRKYLNAVKSEKKPMDKEIIIDVPMALSLAFQGFAWPAEVVAELRAGTLTEKAENITVSPR